MDKKRKLDAQKHGNNQKLTKYFSFLQPNKNKVENEKRELNASNSVSQHAVESKLMITTANVYSMSCETVTVCADILVEKTVEATNDYRLSSTCKQTNVEHANNLHKPHESGIFYYL